MNLINYFVHLVDSQPNKFFLYQGNKTVTFKEMSFSIGAYEKSLAAAGIKKNLQIAIILDEKRSIIEILLAVWKLGAVPVLISPMLTGAETNIFLDCANPDLIITNWKVQKKLFDCNFPVFPIEELSQGFGGCSPFESSNNIDLDVVRLILFTSGTSGKPKKVYLTERNLIESAKAWGEQLKLNKDDIYLNCMPMFHISGISIFIRSLIFGFSNYLIDTFDIETINGIFRSGKITLISMVPTMLKIVLDKMNNSIPSSIRGIIVSGGVSSEDLMNRCLYHKIPVYKSYGMTETSSGICGYWIDRNPSKVSSVGLPFPNMEFKIEDSCLYVTGPMVMYGYLDSEPIDGWFDTGDYGSIDRDGYIYISSRQSDRIVTGGENVSSKEVQDILLTHPQIKSALVFGESDETWGQIVVAKVNSDLSENEIKSWLEDKISNYKIPKLFYNEDF